MVDDRETLVRCVALLEGLSEDTREIKADVKAQNGRVSTLEREVAVLRDRGDQSKDKHARSAGWSGVLLSAISLWWSVFRTWGR